MRSIDSELDVCWLSVPAESSAAFLPVFRAISVAIQTTLRERLPHAYFREITRFSDLNRAYPLLVYQASRPFRAVTKTDLTYDILSPKMTRRLFRGLRADLIELLSDIEARLFREDMAELADRYSPVRALEIVKWVRRLAPCRRALYSLVRSESVLVEALIHLGGLGSVSPSERALRVMAFQKRWDFQIRRLYRRRDFVCLGTTVLDAATRALRESLETVDVEV